MAFSTQRLTVQSMILLSFKNVGSTLQKNFGALDNVLVA